MTRPQPRPDGHIRGQIRGQMTGRPWRLLGIVAGYLIVTLTVYVPRALARLQGRRS